MVLSDPLGDMLTRIRNGQRAGLATIDTPASNLRRRVLDVLQREGYIRGYSEYNVRKGISHFSRMLVTPIRIQRFQQFGQTLRFDKGAMMNRTVRFQFP